MKIFKQSGPIAQIVVFLGFLVVCCLCVMSALIAAASFKGILTLPVETKTATGTVTVAPIWTNTPSPQISFTLTPLPGQWTATSTFLPGQLADTPTPIPTRTVPPVVLLPANTSIPELFPQETLTPETNQNLRLIQLKSVAYQTAYQSFATLHQQLDTDPTLMTNEAWKTKMVAALARLQETARQLAEVDLPDPNYATYASYLNLLYAEVGFMVNAYRKGLERADAAAMQVAMVHLQAMNDVLIKANQEYRAVKSRLATPAFSPMPTSTRDP